jgi:hypothetical protein
MRRRWIKHRRLEDIPVGVTGARSLYRGIADVEDRRLAHHRLTGETDAEKEEPNGENDETDEVTPTCLSASRGSLVVM